MRSVDPLGSCTAWLPPPPVGAWGKKLTGVRGNSAEKVMGLGKGGLEGRGKRLEGAEVRKEPGRLK